MCQFLVTAAMAGTAGQLYARPLLFADGVGSDGNYHLFTYNNGALVNTAGLPSMGPSGQIAVGSNGVLYVPDQDFLNGPGIDEFSATGQYLGQYLTSSFSNGLTAPVGAAWGLDGKLYILDQGTGGNSSLDSFDGTTLTQLTPLPNALDFASGIAFGPGGNLFIADSSGVVFEWNGTSLTPFTSPGVEGGQTITDIAVGPDGNLYVTGTGLGDILVYNGTTGSFMGDYGNTASVLAAPIGLTFASDGSLYVADSNGIQVFDGSGDFVKTLIQADSNPGDLSNAQFLALATPEPSTYGMAALGLVAVGLLRARKRSA